ncbi:MAG: SDR family oxidoreductase, partial [Sphingobacteriales bacterium]
SRGIRVNTVSPGPTRTNVLHPSYGEATANAIWDNLEATMPLKRLGTAEDVAGLVVHLSSERASYITGSDFLIDGGMNLL